MDCINNLIAFGLRQIIGDCADTVVEVVAHAVGPAAKVVAFVQRRFTDHSKALPLALQRANDRAWQTLAIALAGDDWLTSLKLWVTANGDQRGFREEVTQLLKEMPLPFEQSPIRFRKTCLSELKRALAQKHLSAEAINPETLAHRAADFRRYADTPSLIEGAAQAVEQVAEQLAPHYKNLALLLRQRSPAGGPPLLAAAFLYFLRREIATNDELARELSFESLRELSKGQDQLFGFLEESLGQLGKSVDAILEIVLGIREDLAQLRDEIRELAQRNAIPAHRLTPRVAVTIKSGHDQALLKKLWAAYSKLPAAAHDADDLLLLGDTLEAAALFQEANDCYSAAALAAQAKNQEKEAEALYKGYREACQLEQWDIALQQLLRATQLLRERYEPFDLKRYEPVRILGSGGFGTVILCRDLFGRKREVAIKILFAADLEREVDEIFNEAQTLYDLQRGEHKHPAIIGVQYWNYAGGDSTRPYIVMDYFEGESLRSYLEKHKKLSHADLIEVARQVAEGMRAAHGQELLHRDLKPDNILVKCDDQGRWTVRIIDFGLAVKQEAVRTSMVKEAHQQTREDESFAGTFKYSSPEQRRELKGVSVSNRSDIYSWGKTFSEALLGEGITEPKNWDVEEMPAEMQPLGRLLERCTAALPQRRPEHFGEVVTVLEKLRERKAGTKPVKENEEEQKRRAEELQQRKEEERHREEQRRQEEQLRTLQLERQQREQKLQEIENLKRWKESGKVQAWVESRKGVWNHADWVTLVETLQVSEFWPLDLESVGSMLEEAKAGYQRRVETEKKRQAEDQRRREQERIAQQQKEAEDLRRRELENSAKQQKAAEDEKQRERGKKAKQQQEELQKKQQAEEQRRERERNKPQRQPKIVSVQLGTFQSGGFLGLGLKAVQLSMPFAPVPKGTFWMGGGAGICGRKQATISHDFYMGVYPVTQEEWKLVMGTSPSKFQNGGKFPVDSVSWFDCKEFLLKLNYHPNQQKDRSWTYRLPTEEEWEYACRGGATTEEDCSWSYYLQSPSNSLSKQQANFQSVAGSPTKVGSFPANALGIHDMHGNVWEWCESFDNELEKAARGGSWYHAADNCGAAIRNCYTSISKRNCLGFRIARVPSG